MGAVIPRLTLAAVAAFALSSSANAAVTLTAYTAGSGGSAAGEQLVDSFDSAPASGFTFAGGTIVQGSSSNNYEAPAGDASKYLAILGSGFATLTTPAPITELSVYIGSIDSYNSISFYNTANTLVSTFSGSDLLAKQGAPGDGRFYFDLTGQNIGSVVFGSGQNSLEFDDIQAAIPEPGVWAMMLLGMGGLGYALRRRSHNGLVPAA
jgi:fibronectin-binding autotransporter adhesin